MWVARPGTSEHQAGLAVDIVSVEYQVLDEGQEDTPLQQWLMAHCWEYGFILRYPTDKSDLHRRGVRALALPAMWARRPPRPSPSRASAWRSTWPSNTQNEEAARFSRAASGCRKSLVDFLTA